MTITRDDLLSFHESFCSQAAAVMENKNKDYTGAHGADPFANFTRSEALGICSTEQGFLVRMSDKMSRLAAFCHEGHLAVEDEKIVDTLQDLLNYCILLACYLKVSKGEDLPWVERLEPTEKGFRVVRLEEEVSLDRSSI